MIIKLLQVPVIWHGEYLSFYFSVFQLYVTFADQFQVLCQNFEKNACPKQQFRNFACPDLAADLLCQKGNFHFSHVLEDGLLGKYLAITRKKP